MLDLHDAAAHGKRCPFCGSEDLGHRSTVSRDCVECGATGRRGAGSADWQWIGPQGTEAARRAFDDVPDDVEGGG